MPETITTILGLPAGPISLPESVVADTIALVSGEKKCSTGGFNPEEFECNDDLFVEVGCLLCTLSASMNELQLHCSVTSVTITSDISRNFQMKVNQILYDKFEYPALKALKQAFGDCVCDAECPTGTCNECLVDADCCTGFGPTQECEDPADINAAPECQACADRCSLECTSCESICGL